MGYFVTQLIATKVREPDSNGRANWELHEPLVFWSDKVGRVEVPAGFVTDFASVPRLPLVYDLVGDCAHASAVVHDYLHRGFMSNVSHAAAAHVFKEAMKAEGTPAWRRWLMWMATRYA